MSRGWLYRNPPNGQFRLNRLSSQARGLIGWWPVLGSRGQNVLRDYSEYRRTASLGASTAAPVQVLDSRGYSYDFDGTDDYITTNTSCGLNYGTDPFSVAAWFYLDDLGNNHTIVGSGNGDMAPYHYWSPARPIRCRSPSLR